MQLSVAVPVHNEEAVLPELLRRVVEVLNALPDGPHEVVLVDDGSEDRSLEILEAAAATDQRIKVVVLSRNFGHQAALSAALDHVTGDVVVLLDADLQDPPEAIPQLLAPLTRGFDVAYAVRTGRKESILLRAAYSAAYRVIGMLSDVQLPLDAGDFSAMSARVVRAIRSTPEHNRYLRGLRSWVGFQQIGVAVERGERFAGRSKYSARTLMKLAFDGMFAFSIVPLRVATVLGAGAMWAAGLFAIYSIYVRLRYELIPEGFTALLVAIIFLAGVILFFLGVVGEYIGRIYEEVKARPLYVVDRVIRERGGIDIGAGAA